jgi:hypothetical protein
VSPSEFAAPTAMQPAGTHEIPSNAELAPRFGVDVIAQLLPFHHSAKLN